MGDGRGYRRKADVVVAVEVQQDLGRLRLQVLAECREIIHALTVNRMSAVPQY